MLCKYYFIQISDLDKTPYTVRNKNFSRTATLNSIIRTITVEEDVLKQQGAYEENEKTSAQMSKLIGN